MTCDLPLNYTFSDFIESKCAIINDLHNTYKTYTTIKKSEYSLQDINISVPLGNDSLIIIYLTEECLKT